MARRAAQRVIARDAGEAHRSDLPRSSARETYAVLALPLPFAASDSHMLIPAHSPSSRVPLQQKVRLSVDLSKQRAIHGGVQEGRQGHDALGSALWTGGQGTLGLSGVDRSGQGGRDEEGDARKGMCERAAERNGGRAEQAGWGAEKARGLHWIGRRQRGSGRATRQGANADSFG
jgi:hypothetical protein